MATFLGLWLLLTHWAMAPSQILAFPVTPERYVLIEDISSEQIFDFEHLATLKYVCKLSYLD